MSDLRVVTEDLRRAGESLLTCYEEFRSAQDTADRGAEAVEHARLADALREFAAEWDDRRDEICHAIEGLGDAAVGAAEVYEEIERELVRALRGEL
ncbi:hypothetical protein [Candidatus Blastococcus massiliensis]|uniref:hypothetical protein n=1 Tax=Candidatus Blastococcus massiliensis TaxID=1470358 RepID=UPI0004BA13ED|nr:hypothetical protein [Candidatus Blastococcus massiliensis]